MYGETKISFLSKQTQNQLKKIFYRDRLFILQSFIYLHP